MRSSRRIFLQMSALASLAATERTVPITASMRRLGLSRFLHLLFPYWRFFFCICFCCCLFFVSCGFISGFYTHSQGVAMDSVPDGAR